MLDNNMLLCCTKNNKFVVDFQLLHEAQTNASGNITQMSAGSFAVVMLAGKVWSWQKLVFVL
jgi:hypothetical protein